MTLTAEIEKLLRDYRTWLQDKTTLREINGEWVEITTPYLDRHNDALQIYAHQENGGYLLTDVSYTIHDLESSGCTLNTGKRQDLLKMTLNGFGVKLNEEALEIHASVETHAGALRADGGSGRIPDRLRTPMGASAQAD
jgi:hypothetical protein